MMTNTKDEKRIFNSVLRLLRVAPSETIDGDGPASMGARAAAAAWLKAGSDKNAACFSMFCGVLIIAYVGSDRDDERKTEESQSFTDALVADADALARAWSFCRDDGSATVARSVSKYLTTPFDQSQDGLRSMRSPQKRRALLLLRAVFRPPPSPAFGARFGEGRRRRAGVLKLFDMARDSFDFYVMKTPILRDVVLAAADLVFGNN